MVMDFEGLYHSISMHDIEIPTGFFCMTLRHVGSLKVPIRSNQVDEIMPRIYNHSSIPELGEFAASISSTQDVLVVEKDGRG